MAYHNVVLTQCGPPLMIFLHANIFFLNIHAKLVFKEHLKLYYDKPKLYFFWQI